METKVYTQEGKEKDTITLPASVFGMKWNADLMHQVTTGMLSNARAGTADTKGRGEVRGGGRKPWKQKGTGQARHGSTRSPIWVGGGVTHGPLAEKNYKKKINQKMRVRALMVALSEKFRHGQVLFVDGLSLAGKTKDASKIFQSFSKIKGFERLAYSKTVAFISLPENNTTITRSIRNLPQLVYGLTKDLNPLDVLSYKYLVIVDPTASMKILEKKLEKKPLRSKSESDKGRTKKAVK